MSAQGASALVDRIIEHEQFRLAYERKRNELRSILNEQSLDEALIIEEPENVIADLQSLDGVLGEGASDEVAEGSVGRRTLFIEFFCLSSTDICAFLVPLWRDDSIRAIRLSTMGTSIVESVRDLIRASQDLGHDSRCCRGLHGRSMSADQQRAAYRDIRNSLNAMDKLIAPLDPYLCEWMPTGLIVSPHSVLNMVPFHALTWNGRQLIEWFPVTYLPSGAVAGEVRKQVKSLVPTALLLGDPSEDLAWSAREVEVVGDVLKASGFRVAQFTGGRAAALAFTRMGPLASIVHFACHTVLDPDDFERAGVRLSDRRLTAFEIMAATELKASALVFLSSCDGAYPATTSTNELVALIRAFLYAGSPSVVASLWMLEDEVACMFAQVFYRAWIQERRPLCFAFQAATSALSKSDPPVLSKTDPVGISLGRDSP